MFFPNFINGMKNHMPFINKCNGEFIYMCCMTKPTSREWKIFYNQKGEWKRLTNSGAGVIECSPSIYYDKGYYVSYVTTDQRNPYTLHCLYGESLDSLIEIDNTDSLCGFYFENILVKLLDKSIVGIYENSKLIRKIDFFDYDFVYRLTYSPNTNQILTTVAKDEKFENYIIDGYNLYLVKCDNKNAYKFFKYNDEYWYVVQFGSGFESRYIRKAKSVSLEKISGICRFEEVN